mmetsp:Transcript_33589/g.51682  ORF Transcript_33589/g.51682 Transcript_33589/m.51682 type:complete len:96 (-) Transcript_33589:2549-2836(-)
MSSKNNKISRPVLNVVLNTDSVERLSKDIPSESSKETKQVLHVIKNSSELEMMMPPPKKKPPQKQFQMINVRSITSFIPGGKSNMPKLQSPKFKY